MFLLEDIDMGQYEFVGDEGCHAEPQGRSVKAVDKVGVPLSVYSKCLRSHLGELVPCLGELQAPGKTAE